MTTMERSEQAADELLIPHQSRGGLRLSEVTVLLKTAYFMGVNWQLERTLEAAEKQLQTEQEENQLLHEMNGSR